MILIKIGRYKQELTGTYISNQCLSVLSMSLMGVVGRNQLQILAIMLELCLSQIACYYAQNYAHMIISSLAREAC